MLDRVMSRDLEELKTYTAHEAPEEKRGIVVLDDNFAGEIVDMEKMGYET